MFFKDKKDNSIKENSKPQKPDNPYVNAREEWLERYGSYIKRAAQWRAIALFCLLITLTSITMNFVQVMQVKTVPYIVEVDKLGRSIVAHRADEANIAPHRLIQAAIAMNIHDWRTVTADIELQRKMIERLSHYFAGSAQGVLRQWFKDNNPYEIAETGKLIHIEIKSLPLPVSSNSYRIEWVETMRSHQGIVLDQNTYEATVTIQINPPTTEAVLLQNPGGIYITQIAASKVLNVSKNADRNKK